MSARTKTLGLATMAVLALLCAAPTAGDVGGCGVTVQELDEARFARARKLVDCNRCTECGITTKRCAAACDPKAPNEVGFPARCFPLYHDGEVCLDALLSSSCSDYAVYVDDDTRVVPTECEFCKGGDR
ncbi:hypothetical protein BH09MYX1_BH09MYX1_26470 [soil metagenome]